MPSSVFQDTKEIEKNLRYLQEILAASEYVLKFDPSEVGKNAQLFDYFVAIYASLDDASRHVVTKILQAIIPLYEKAILADPNTFFVTRDVVDTAYYAEQEKSLDLFRQYEQKTKLFEKATTLIATYQTLSEQDYKIVLTLPQIALLLTGESSSEFSISVKSSGMKEIYEYLRQNTNKKIENIKKLNNGNLIFQLYQDYDNNLRNAGGHPAMWGMNDRERDQITFCDAGTGWVQEMIISQLKEKVDSLRLIIYAALFADYLVTYNHYDKYKSATGGFTPCGTPNEIRDFIEHSFLMYGFKIISPIEINDFTSISVRASYSLRDVISNNAKEALVCAFRESRVFKCFGFCDISVADTDSSQKNQLLLHDPATFLKNLNALGSYELVIQEGSKLVITL